MITIMSKEDVKRAITRLAFTAIEQSGGCEGLVLLGIRTRGVILARRMKEIIDRSEGTDIPLGILDISLQRDDLLSDSCDAIFRGSEIDFDLDGKKVALCDDVLYSGRTVRAALAAISALGRPDFIKLYELVDRGHRELPFRADGVGKSMPTSSEENVLVRFEETDGEDAVYLFKQGEPYPKAAK